MQETGKEFTDASLKNAYSQFEKSWKRLDYKFNIILVDDESSAKSVIAGLSNGIAFDAIAKEKSVHKSSDSSKPGFVDFLREDVVAQQFGPQVLASMRNLNANDLSKAPIRTANGKFAVIKLLSKRNSPVPSFEDAKSALRMQLTNEKFSKLIEDEIKSGRVKLYTFDGKEQKFDDIFKKNKPTASAK
jgi:peptidyl-prolyl cis-trans isomerase C